MSEAYTVLAIGAIAGLLGAFLGGMMLYRSHLQTHSAIRDRLEEERTALHTDISEIDQEELLQTDAGKDLLSLSQSSIQKFGYPRENVTTSLRRHNYDLLKQIDEYRKKLAQSEERLMAMAVMQEESAKVVENLKKGLTDLRLSGSLKPNVPSSNSAQLEQDLRTTLTQVARLQNQLAETNMRLVEVEARRLPPFAQEVQQTLSACLQSIDLLLDGSVGTLNPMQRNLLDTTKAATARLNGVIEDFVQITTFKTSSSGNEPVDLNSIVQDAIDETSGQIHAKRITLNVDVTENIEPLSADREALRQILIRLLSNAGAATPLQGTMRLQVERKVNDGKEYILIQVSDMGGGIPAEDMGRVFTPLYRAHDVPARGVGETGLGLFLAKTLTEAQNGRIWVETEPGVGSTYNVLIPISREPPADVSPEEQSRKEG